MTDEETQGFTAEELGLEPESFDEGTTTATVQPDGTIGSGLTEDQKRAVLMESIETGQMIPAAWAQHGQTQQREPVQDDDDNDLMYRGEAKAMLASERDRMRQEIQSEFDGRYGRAIASMQANDVAREVADVMPEAGPIARRLVEQMGASAVGMTPEVKKLVMQAAVGEAVMSQRSRAVPGHNDQSTSAPRYMPADGIGAEDIAFYQRQFASIHGRQATTKELREEGYLK